MSTLHTAVISRHFKHEDNVGTRVGIQEVLQNAESTKTWLGEQGLSHETIVNPQIGATDKLRTQSTAELIANTLLGEGYNHAIKEKTYLNLEPASGPMKETLEKLNILYDKDPDVLAGKPADNFVNKFQNNELEDVDFNKFAVFYCTKLLNILNYIERTQNSNFSITGIHGGYFFESVLYGLFADSFHKEWKGQIRMGEQSILQFVETESGEVGINFVYRGVERTITKGEIEKRIQTLRGRGEVV